MHWTSNIFEHSATIVGGFWVSLSYPILNFKKRYVQKTFGYCTVMHHNKQPIQNECRVSINEKLSCLKYCFLMMEEVSLKRSLIKHTCSWRDKLVLWTLNRQAKTLLHIGIFFFKLILGFYNINRLIWKIVFRQFGVTTVEILSFLATFVSLSE